MHCKFKESQLVVRNPGTYILVVLYDEAFILLQFEQLVATTTYSCGASMKTTDSRATGGEWHTGKSPPVAQGGIGIFHAGNVVDALCDRSNQPARPHVCRIPAVLQLCHWPFSAARRIQIGSSLLHPSRTTAASRSRAQLNSRIRSTIRNTFTTTAPSRLMVTN